MHGSMCLMGGVIGDSVHHVAYARHVALLKRAGGGGSLDVWGVTSRALMMRLVFG